MSSGDLINAGKVVRAPLTPWRVDEEDFCIRDKEGRVIVRPTPEINLRQIVTLRRIVACVNACEHFSTVGLERVAARGDSLEFALRSSVNAKVEGADAEAEWMKRIFGIEQGSE